MRFRVSVVLLAVALAAEAADQHTHKLGELELHHLLRVAIRREDRRVVDLGGLCVVLEKKVRKGLTLPLRRGWEGGSRDRK